MARAIWNGKVIAESNETQMVEGNHYFPPEAIHNQYFKESSTRTHCGWKGEACYYTLEVDGQQNVDAAWYYPTPKSAASNITDHVAFWKGVTVESSADDQTHSNPSGEGTCEI